MFSISSSYQAVFKKKGSKLSIVLFIEFQLPAKYRSQAAIPVERADPEIDEK